MSPSASSETWSSPVVSGSRPPPCEGFTLTKMSDNTAILFGGWYPKLKQLNNDVYILDLESMVRHNTISTTISG